MKQQQSSGKKKHSLKTHIYTAQNKTCYITKENMQLNTNIYTTLYISAHAIYSTLEAVLNIYIPIYTRFIGLLCVNYMRFLYMFMLVLITNYINVIIYKTRKLNTTQQVYIV